MESDKLRRYIEWSEESKLGVVQWTEMDEFRLQIAKELVALQWTPITPENLPKVGDEVYAESFPIGQQVCSVAKEDVQEGTLESLREDGWTHFRAINAPPEAPHD